MPEGTMRLRCEVCGATAIKGQHGAQCRYGCFVIKPGWIVRDANAGRVRFLRYEAVALAREYHTYDELSLSANPNRKLASFCLVVERKKDGQPGLDGTKMARD